LLVLVQLIAWNNRPRNDLLCVERNVKQLLTHLKVLRFMQLPFCRSICLEQSTTTSPKRWH